MFDFIAHQTLFCRRLAEGLGAAYIALPSTLEGRGVQDKQTDTIQAGFVNRLQFCNAVMMACASDSSGSILAEHLCRDLLRWYVFLWFVVFAFQRVFDLIVRVVVVVFFVLLFRFLKPCLYPALSSVNESAQVAAMSYTAMMLEVLHETASRSPLIALLTRFVLGLQVDREEKEQEQEAQQKQESGSKEETKQDTTTNRNDAMDTGNALRAQLVHRMNSQVPSVSYAALTLFNALLEVHDSHVLANLILRNVEPTKREKNTGETIAESTAATPTAPTNHTSAPTVGPTVGPTAGPQADASQPIPTTPVLATPLKRKSLQGPSNFLSPTAVFLDGFPGSPKPKPGTATRPLVFEDYLTDAHTQSVARMARMAVYWSDAMLSSTGTPKKKRKKKKRNSSLSSTTSAADQLDPQPETKGATPSTTPGTTPTDSGTVVADVAVVAATPALSYIEGSFMCALYDKLEGMLDESLDENLVLTEIFAKLAQCPDQRVQDLLVWEGDEEGKEGKEGDEGESDRRSLVNVLKSVWVEAQERVAEVDRFEEAIDAHRIRLGTVLEGRRESDGEGGGSGGNRTKVQSSFCEGYVVLEEFVKEISAIIQARGELKVLYQRLL